MIFSSRGCFKSTELSRIANQKLSKEYVSYLSDWSICHFFSKNDNKSKHDPFLRGISVYYTHMSTQTQLETRGVFDFVLRWTFSDNVYPEVI